MSVSHAGPLRDDGPAARSLAGACRGGPNAGMRGGDRREGRSDRVAFAWIHQRDEIPLASVLSTLPSEAAGPPRGRVVEQRVGHGSGQERQHQ